MKKTYDCIEMKRHIQEKILQETKGMSRAEELAYFHAGGKAFWKRIREGGAKPLPAGMGPGQPLKVKKKAFDCVEMKHRIQAELQQRAQGMSYEEERRFSEELIASDPILARFWARRRPAGAAPAPAEKQTA